MKKSKPKKKIELEQPVYDVKGKKVDKITLNSKVFDGTVNIPLLHQVAVMYNANLRSGTASVKTRGDVSGSGRKPWRQKGTGRARTGSIRNPLWRKGGVIFGPHPRDFYYDMPQKIKKGAVLSSLNSKLQDENIIVINEMKLDNPKTKVFSSILESLGIKKGASVMVVLKSVDKNVKLASRNIPRICVRSVANGLSALELLRHKKLIIEETALKNLMTELA